MLKSRNVDHVILGTPDPEATVTMLSKQLGVDFQFGGAHPKHGTSNFIIGFGNDIYLEVLGPGNGAFKRDEVGERLAALDEPRLVGIALATPDMKETTNRAVSQALILEEPAPDSRITPQGTELHWETVFFDRHNFGDMLFFAIDWKDTPHPSRVKGIRADLDLLEIGSKHQDYVAACCDLLDCDIAVIPSATPLYVRARISGPNGSCELSSDGAPLSLAV